MHHGTGAEDQLDWMDESDAQSQSDHASLLPEELTAHISDSIHGTELYVRPNLHFRSG
jgi:hypothetical protein